MKEKVKTIVMVKSSSLFQPIILILVGIVIGRFSILNSVCLSGHEQQKSSSKYDNDQNDIFDNLSYLRDGKKLFYKTAKSFDPVTDKVTHHAYQTMYGQFLLPYSTKFPRMKLLEIGLGCHIVYGPGASVKLWKKLFPLVDLWEAEYNAECVEQKKKDGTLSNINVLVGDQSDPVVLNRWIETSGGEFDVIIDDGGHSNCQIWTTYEKLWPTVKSGGLYFIEDMHAGMKPNYRVSTQTCDGTNLTVSEEIKKMIDNLIYHRGRALPDVEFVLCQKQACVLGKA